jgi:alpha-mannosidase
MKKFFPLIAVIIFPLIALGQTNVDRVAGALDSLATLQMNDFKMSPNLKLGEANGDPTQEGFDDSQWQTVKIAQRLHSDSCWLRKEIVLPEYLLGTKVGGTVKLLVSADEYGYLWINEATKGYFPGDGVFVLSSDAKPGDKFLIVIRAITTWGTIRLRRADIEMESTDTIRQAIKDFSMSIRVGQKLLSTDTKQVSPYDKKVQDFGIDKSKIDKGEKEKLNKLLQEQASRLDLDALRSSSMEKFAASLNDVRSQLKPVAEYAKRFTLSFDANAHIDAAWLWRDKETVEVCRNTFTSVLNMMDARPDFSYTQSAALYYDWMKQKYPDVFNRIAQRVKDGRWEVVGGMWVEPDCNLPSGESWMHHLLISKRYFRKELGTDVKIGWNPDSFGYNWNMPEFYLNAGIDAFITQKLGWNDTNIFPYRVFWWEGEDGSRILTYFPYDYVNEIEDPFQLADWMRQFDANTGFTRMMVLFGVGDHGGGPTNEMLDRIEHLKHLDIYPSIEYCTAAQYIDWLKKQDPAEIPTWKDELYLEYHQGTFTTQAKMKEYNRQNEGLLTSAEKFSTIATMYGRSYNHALLNEAWKNVLFNQFHDILPGSGIRENYMDATERHKAAKKSGEFELQKSIETIASNIGTSNITKGTPVVVFNQLSWERTDVAAISLPEGDTSQYAVFQSDGKEVASQVVETSLLERQILFIAERVPSFGFKTYELRKQRSKFVAGMRVDSSFTIENDYFRVTVGRDSGWVRNIIDRMTGREYLAGNGNKLQLLEDKPKQWDAWNLGLTGKEYPQKLRRIEVVERGPVRWVIRVTHDCLGPSFRRDYPTPDFPSSFFTQDIILYKGVYRVDFKTDVDWWEEHTMLKVAFPISTIDSVATYEIPYGTIQRSTQMENSWERARVEVPAERWADLSGHGYGASLMNRSKYGYDIKGHTIRLSLLRSPLWPDPTADRGKHSIEYSLYPHPGTWKDANTVGAGYEYNNPLIVVTTDSHKGRLPVSGSLIQLGPPNLILTVLKKAEDSDSWIIQWYESQGIDSDALLWLPQAPTKVVTSNFLEEDGEPAAFDGHTVRVKTKKNSVVTLKITF